MNKTLLILLTFALFVPAQAQYMGASVGYMKVKPGQWNNYLELEKDTKEFHQARVEKGIITQWQLYEKMYSGADDPYDFIVVSFFNDYSNSEGGVTWKLATEMYSEEERAEFWKRMGETRTQVKVEYYDQVAASDEFKPAKYIRVNLYKTKPGNAGPFIQSRREITQPLFSEFVKRGHMAGWSLWQKLTYDQEFQFTSVDAFEEFGQWKSGIPYEEIWKEVHPDKEQSEVMPEYRDLRMPVRSEYWKLVEFTVPKQE